MVLVYQSMQVVDVELRDGRNDEVGIRLELGAIVGARDAYRPQPCDSRGLQSPPRVLDGDTLGRLQRDAADVPAQQRHRERVRIRRGLTERRVLRGNDRGEMMSQPGV